MPKKTLDYDLKIETDVTHFFILLPEEIGSGETSLIDTLFKHIDAFITELSEINERGGYEKTVWTLDPDKGNLTISYNPVGLRSTINKETNKKKSRVAIYVENIITTERPGESAIQTQYAVL